MAVDKITSPATPLEVVNKINEVIDNQGGGGGGSITIDDAISSTSTNPVQNKVIYTALSGKQDTLVSGTNIKTINNTSLLGSGNIDIQGGGSSYTAGTGIDITNNEISVDNTIALKSEIPVVEAFTASEVQTIWNGVS